MISIYHGNEELLSKWFARTGKRHEIFLASKGAIKMEGMTFKGIDSSGKYLKDACEKSLARLNVEYIDLCKSAIAEKKSHWEVVLLIRNRLRPSPESGYTHRRDHACPKRASTVSGFLLTIRLLLTPLLERARSSTSASANHLPRRFDVQSKSHPLRPCRLSTRHLCVKLKRKPPRI